MGTENNDITPIGDIQLLCASQKKRTLIILHDIIVNSY